MGAEESGSPTIENRATWITATNSIKVLWISGRRSLREREGFFYRRPGWMLCWCWNVDVFSGIRSSMTTHASCTKAFVHFFLSLEAFYSIPSYISITHNIIAIRDSDSYSLYLVFTLSNLIIFLNGKINKREKCWINDAEASRARLILGSFFWI